MFSYTLLKGVRLGLLDASLEDYARKVYDGLVRTFISEDDNGLLNINQCCSVGGLGGDARRTGDYDYYLSEPIRANDPKGVGPFIWASLEMERR
jgi:unsaturated rhamnogalacturonyl hydrolase